MPKKSEIKRELILTKAKEVFIRKGFNRTTMKDIVDECEISRGGIYLYFSATDEIFVEVVKKHNSAKIQLLKEKIEESNNFKKLLDEFFTEQKDRLLNMDKSLFVAMTEFCFSHKNAKDFYTEQFFNTKKMILELLKFGRKSNSIKAKNIQRLADSVMFLIEGLRSLAVSGNITEKIANEQINICRNMVLCD
jgi:AcrR family transcriptional regulator